MSNKPDSKKMKDALNQLLKAAGSDKSLDEILGEKLPCGHTQEEHMFASFLTKQAADVGVSPKTLLGAAKTIIENEESLLQLQAEMDAKDALGLESSDAAPGATPMLLSPMPKEVQ